MTEESFSEKNGEAELILENVCQKLSCGSSPSEIYSIGKNLHDKTAISAYLCLVNKNLPEAEKLILQAQEECGASEVSDIPLYPSYFNSRHAFWQKVAAKIASWREQTIIGLFCIAARLVLLGQVDVAKKLFETGTTISNTTPLDEVDGSIAAWYQAEYFLNCGQVSCAVKALEGYQPGASPTERLSNLKTLMHGLDKLPPPLETLAIRVPELRSAIPEIEHWSSYPIITITSNKV